MIENFKLHTEFLFKYGEKIRSIIKEEGAKDEAIDAIIQLFIKGEQPQVTLETQITQGLIDRNEPVGFFEDGWEILPELMFDTPKLSNEKKIELINTWKEVFDSIQVDPKIRDALVCFGVSAPFFSVIRQIEGFIPLIYLRGAPYTGKSSLVYFLTTDFWGIGSKTTIPESNQRLLKTLSWSSFPAVFDEMGKIKPEVQSFFEKLSFSSDIFLENKQQRKMYPTSPIFAIGSDNQECLNKSLKFRLKKEIDSAKEFNSLLQRYKDLARETGDIGRLVYEYTKDWGIKTISEKLNKIKFKMYPDFSNLPWRNFVSLCILELGRNLIENALGMTIETSTEDFFELISASFS
jgi:hypothetical protein